jgi:uncharacterized protein DUF2752
MVRSGWRPRSIPEQLGLVGLATAAVAAVYPAVSEATGVQLVCPLRTLTGVPCPMCGMTTAALALARGDLGGVVAANPFLLLLVAGTLAMAVVMVGRIAGRLAPPREPTARTENLLRAGALVLTLGSWVFQLHRTGWI